MKIFILLSLLISMSYFSCQGQEKGSKVSSTKISADSINLKGRTMGQKVVKSDE